MDYSEGAICEDSPEDDENKWTDAPEPQVAPQADEKRPQETAPRRSSRNQNRRTNYGGMGAVFELIESMSGFITDFLLDCLPTAFTKVFSTAPDPKSHKKAMESKDRKSWKQACEKEWDFLIKKEVWSLVDRPGEKSVIRGM